MGALPSAMFCVEPSVGKSWTDFFSKNGSAVLGLIFERVKFGYTESEALRGA